MTEIDGFSSKRLKAEYYRLKEFLKTGIWRVRIRELSPLRALGVNFLRIVLLTLRGFRQDRCYLNASALTFFTLLSIVPVAAVAFGIAKGFGFEKFLRRQLFEKFPGQEEIITQIVDFAQRLLENTQGGMIAGVGSAILFYTVIKVLGHIEKSFNDIWGIKKSRSIGRKFSDYLSIFMIGPLLLITSGSVTVFIKTQITQITEQIALLGYFSPMIFFMFNFIPMFLIWIVFTFMYMLLPNTKVNFSSGFMAAVIAGTFYQIIQWGYIKFQIGVANYNAIYGSFAVLPLFLIWLQLSWLIVLLGTEISRAHQHIDDVEYNINPELISFHYRKMLSLQIVHTLAVNFQVGNPPLDVHTLSKRLDIPERIAESLLRDLADSNIVAYVKPATDNDDNSIAYQPAFDIHRMTIQSVIQALENKGIDNIPVAGTEEWARLSESLRIFRETAEKSPANQLLIEI